jgi:hypothetical protein
MLLKSPLDSIITEFFSKYRLSPGRSSQSGLLLSYFNKTYWDLPQQMINPAISVVANTKRENSTWLTNN